MILKFKRFWSCLILVACTFGLVTPMPSHANGNGNVELQVLGIVGACAAVGTLIGLPAGSFWLKKKKEEAKALQKNNSSNLGGKISIDEWCRRLKNQGVIIQESVAFKKIIDDVLDANEEATIFKKSYRNEKNKYSAFLKDIHSEMNNCHRVMETAKSFSFGSGLTEFPRTAFTVFPELDWKYQSFMDICRNPRNNLVTADDNIYPEDWTPNQIQSMERSVYEYITQIPKYNSITRLAVETWWIYFQKYYRLEKLKPVVAQYSTERDREIKAEEDRLAKIKAEAEASAHHTHQHVHVDNNRPTIVQQQPPVQPLQVAQQKPNYLKQAAYLVGAVLMGTGLYTLSKAIWIK